MKKIAKFEKVSEEQFSAAWLDTFGEEQTVYDEILLPKRATSGSAGYDFFAPLSFSLAPGETIKIPTGIRAWMEDSWVLKIYPRSGLGFKFRLQLNNTVGIIDGDYAFADNEGHIMIKLTNPGEKSVTLSAGTAIAQGVFLPYGITFDDSADAKRHGGFGSTSL